MKKSATGLSVGMCIGSGIGVVLWIITENVLWFTLGISLGLCIGAGLGSLAGREKDGDWE